MQLSQESQKIIQEEEEDVFESQESTGFFQNIGNSFSGMNPLQVFNFLFCKLPPKIHASGITPFAYHTVEMYEIDQETQYLRVQHLKATAFWTFSLITAGALAFLGAYGFNKTVRKEDQFLEGLHDVAHFGVVALTIVGLSLAFGALIGGLHFGLNKLCKVKPADLVELRETDSDGSIIKQDEKTPILPILKGSDGKQFRFSPISYSPAKLFQVKPLNTGGWFTVLAVAGLSLASYFNPDVLTDLRDSGYGHTASIVVGSALFGGLASAVATAAHKVGAKVTEKCCGSASHYSQPVVG